MRLRAHARTRIGAAVMAVATAAAVAPPAHAVPVRRGAEVVAAVPPKKTSKRHWARHRWFGGWHPRTVSRPTRRPSVAEIVLAKARAQLGKPYVYGAAGPNSFDCSGLTQFAWAAAGAQLPHNAAAQYASTRRVPLKDMRPGDLVFSSGLGHVGIYIGGGRMIHAPQSGRNVEISPLRSSVMGAGRVR